MQRPGSITVFAILNIFFGGLGLLCAPFSFAHLMAPETPDPAGRLYALMRQPPYGTWLLVSGVLSALASAVLLAGGIGMLRLRPWARTAGLAAGGTYLAQAVIGSLLYYLFIFVPGMRMAEQAAGPEGAALSGGLYSGLLGGVCSSLYPMVLVLFLTRAETRAFFQGGNPGER